MREYRRRIVAVICVIMCCLFVLNSCANKPLPDLAGDAIAFEIGTFIDNEHDDAAFSTIEYNGRTYIAYGTINNKYKQRYIESCIGYIVQDEKVTSVADPSNTNWRIYTLSEDPEHNFLMDFDDTVKLMNQPNFFRAVDTKGKDIRIPDYIDSLSYEFWEDE